MKRMQILWIYRATFGEMRTMRGFHSGAALATVVGVLIEVPVSAVNRSQHWYEAKHSIRIAE